MIVQCNECNSRYRIAGEKLPSGGGKIKCPNCANVFRVETAAVATPVETEATAEPGGALAGVTAEGQPTSGGWKLRNAMGLVFEFPDTESIAKWLQARDSFDGIEVSGDKGAAWHAVSAVPSLTAPGAGYRQTIAGMPAIVRPLAGATAAAATPEPDSTATAADVPATDWSQPAAPGPDDIKRQAEERLRAKRAERAQQAPAPKQEAPKRAYRQVRRAPKRKNNVFVMGATLLALTAIIIVVLEMQGIIALGDVFAGSSSETSIPDALRPADGTAANAGSGTESGAEVPSEASQEDEIVQQLIIEAEELALNGDPAGSVRTLERARGIDANRADVYCRLSVAYERAERIDDAQAAHARCLELQE